MAADAERASGHARDEAIDQALAAESAEHVGVALWADSPEGDRAQDAALDPWADSAAGDRAEGTGAPAQRRISRRSAGVIAVAAVLVVAGALTAHYVAQPVDGGPLSIATVDSTGTVPRSYPAMVVFPIAASRSAVVVIDSVDLRGGDQRRPPVPMAVLGDRNESCSGIWWPIGGVGSFSQRCAPHGTIPLIGRSIPIGGPAWAGTARRSVRMIDVAIEVQAAGLGHCWDIGKVLIQYHVGHQHYTATGLESIAACAGLTAETRHGPVAADS